MSINYNSSSSDRDMVVASSEELDLQQNLQDHLIRRIAEAYASGDNEAFDSATAIYDETTSLMEEIRVHMFYSARIDDLRTNKDRQEGFEDPRTRIASLVGAVVLMGARLRPHVA